jgi:hypothetical protein
MVQARAGLLRLWTLVFAFAGALAAPAGAVPIGRSDFVRFVVESFEHLEPGEDVGVQPGLAGVYLLGNGDPYRFASGVTLVGPSRNVFPGDPFVHDLGVPGATRNDWGANGVVDAAGDVPMGSAYLAIFEAGTREASITLTFDTLQARVGASVTGQAGSTVTLEVYGPGGVRLETRTVSTVPVAGWRSNFLGIERTEGISHVVFRGHDFGIDGLRFDDLGLAPVPEPKSAVLVAFGLAVLAAARRPRP